jgi:mono-ADP-ribosyltransferase sirtuin 6
MSAGYASRLKEYPHKGVCGLPEKQDTPRQLKSKLARLVELMQPTDRPRRIVIVTGAGISTVAGIPDFRGPSGIWTLEKKKTSKKRPLPKKPRFEPTQDSQSTMDFAAAQPTLTHRAITYLTLQKGVVRFVVTQNVDGLHRRSGLSRDHHAVLHGCVFTERCNHCGREYFRDKDVGGMSFHPTGRLCDIPCVGKENSKGILVDTLLDWEDALPEDDLDRATTECETADLVLCLGTSLRIEPAGSLPTLAKDYVIVNLQVTPKDEEASLIIRAKADIVMTHLLEALGFVDWEKDMAQNPPTIERVWLPPAPAKPVTNVYSCRSRRSTSQ